jgi:hypothetical protein
MFDSLTIRMDEMTNDTAAKLANFDENLQANTRHPDDLFVAIQQIQQALPLAVSQADQITGPGLRSVRYRPSPAPFAPTTFVRRPLSLASGAATHG